jgi:hypothetical protein
MQWRVYREMRNGINISKAMANRLYIHTMKAIVSESSENSGYQSSIQCNGWHDSGCDSIQSVAGVMTGYSNVYRSLSVGWPIFNGYNEKPVNKAINGCIINHQLNGVI